MPEWVRDNWEVHEWKHACAILKNDYPAEWSDILDLLRHFRFRKSWINVGGGAKSKVAGEIDAFLMRRGWVEKEFATAIQVDGRRRAGLTHYY